jgi:hypothetical protein
MLTETKSQRKVWNLEDRGESWNFTACPMGLIVRKKHAPKSKRAIIGWPEILDLAAGQKSFKLHDLP